MYNGINIRNHNKSQLQKARTFLLAKNALHPGPAVIAPLNNQIEQEGEAEDEDSSMWAEIERMAQIAKQNRINKEREAGGEREGEGDGGSRWNVSNVQSYNYVLQSTNRIIDQPSNITTSRYAGIHTSSYTTKAIDNYTSVPQNNGYLSWDNSQESVIPTCKQRLANYMYKNAKNKPKFIEPSADQQSNTEQQEMDQMPKYESLNKQKIKKEKGKNKKQKKAKQPKISFKQQHYIPQNIIEYKDPNLFTIDYLKVEAPLVKNYRIGNKEQWQSNRRIEDYKLQFALRRFPKIKDYRNNQKAIIKCSLLGNDVFVCMPTGGGKSLTFQAMTFIEKGVYLCILPLVSLIIDQEQQAKKIGIKAYSLTGSKQIQDNKMIYQELAHYEPGSDSIVVFCTPEKVHKSPQFFGVLQQVYQKKALVKIVIDEVHCVSTWGKEFRQDYENLSSLKENFPKTPILGLTATVTQVIKQDIIKRLGIQNCFYFQSSFNRPNLYYQVKQKTKDILSNIIKILADYQNQSGIIYCISRKDCQQMCSQLQAKRFKVAFYHANISENQKREIQSQWMENRIQIIIATIAFGMGINKPDVRFVIHHSLSKSLENYYQESGRAGRDGQDAKCILFYRRADKISLQSLIMKNQISKDENKSFCMRQLSNMIKYCEDRYTCRRKFQLDYLGQKDFNASQCNKTCDNCKRGLQYIEVQCIKEAKCLVGFMMQIERIKQNINQNQISLICKGSSQKKFKYKLEQIERSIDLTEIRGMLGKWNRINIDELLIQLCSHEIFYQKIVTSTFKNNTVSNFYLKVNFPLANKFLNKVQTLPMKRSVNPRVEKKQNPTTDLSEYELDFQDLRVTDNYQQINVDKFEDNTYHYKENFQN